jgi:hypothetical protein
VGSSLEGGQPLPRLYSNMKMQQTRALNYGTQLVTILWVWCFGRYLAVTAIERKCKHALHLNCSSTETDRTRHHACNSFPLAAIHIA